jgi:hypothetical protein
VIGDTFQFQTDGADNPRTGIGFEWGQCFHRLGHAQAVADSRITGNDFDQDWQSLDVRV